MIKMPLGKQVRVNVNRRRQQALDNLDIGWRYTSRMGRTIILTMDPEDSVNTLRRKIEDREGACDGTTKN
jgi:hypothetical protein